MNKIIKYLSLITLFALFGGFFIFWIYTRGITFEQIDSLPWAWYISRITGIISYILLWVIVVFGLILTTNTIEKLKSKSEITRGETYTVHRHISLTLAVFLLIHAFSLLFDHYLSPTLQDILIPFSIDISTNFVALGIFAFYFIIIIILVSLFPKKFTKSVWRLTHYLSFFVFIFVSIHGFYSGTDSNIYGIKILYLIFPLTVTLLIIRRIYLVVKPNEKQN